MMTVRMVKSLMDQSHVGIAVWVELYVSRVGFSFKKKQNHEVTSITSSKLEGIN